MTNSQLPRTTTQYPIYSGITQGNQLTVVKEWLNTNLYQWVNGGDFGGGQAHSNLQPFVTVYQWLRTA